MAGSTLAPMFLALVVIFIVTNNGVRQSEKGERKKGMGRLDNSPKIWSGSVQHMEMGESSHLRSIANNFDNFGVKAEPYRSQKAKLHPVYAHAPDTTSSWSTTTDRLTTTSLVSIVTNNICLLLRL